MAKQARSKEAAGKKKRGATGKRAKKKVGASRRGHGSSSSPKKKVKPTGKAKKARKPVSLPGTVKRTAARPQGVRKQGKNTIKGRVRVNSAERGRPAHEDLNAWLSKRKHVDSWRNKDGSYEALITFKGGDVTEQLRRAMRRCPGRPYMQVRFFEKASLEADDIGTDMVAIVTGGRKVWLKVVSSPTTHGRTPAEGLDWAMTWYDPSDPRIYHRRIGISVYWAPNKKESK